MHTKIDFTMEKEEKDILMKARSSRACIRDGYKMYTGKFRRIFRHTWLMAIVFAILTTVATALPVLVDPSIMPWAILMEAVAVAALLWAANRQLCRRGFFEKTGHVGMKAWVRHTGMVTLVSIVCLFIVVVLILLTSLPMIIMMAANWESQMGVINGDPVGMPGYVVWLSLGAFLIAGFLQAYVWITILCPFFLMRVSVAEQEKERQEFNKKDKALNTQKYEQNLIYRP